MSRLLYTASTLLILAAIVAPCVQSLVYDPATTSFPLWATLLSTCATLSIPLLLSALLFAALGRIVGLLEMRQRS